MRHNYEVAEQGHCKCPCHRSATAPCWCGAPDILRSRKQPKAMRKVKLESRVKPFTRSYQVPMSVTGKHHTHPLTDLSARGNNW